MREVALGMLLWSMLLIVLIAVLALPELGGWSGWLTQIGR